jgi:glycosyltransferase involved in cell wall biosynthesis
MKTRVVIVTDTLYPWFVGGKERRLFSFVESMDNTDFEIIFATMKWWDGPAPRGHVSISRKYEVYKNGRRSIISALAFSLACLKILSLRPHLVEADQIPILHLWPLKMICRIRKIPFSVTWHEVWSKPYWLKYLGPLGHIAAMVEKWTLSLPDRFVAVSEMTRSRLIAEGVPAEKIALIENTLDIAGIRGAETSLPETDLLFVGRLMSHKRIDLLLLALQELKSKGQKPTLSIVGSGPEELNLQSQVLELGIEDQITFYAQGLESSDVWGLMKKCPIFLLPSEREGFGIAVQEALLVGATVLVSNHQDNAARHLIDTDSKGRVVQEQSAHFWADALNDVLSSGPTSNRAETREMFEEDPLDDFVEEYKISWNKTLALK